MPPLADVDLAWCPPGRTTGTSWHWRLRCRDIKTPWTATARRSRVPASAKAHMGTPLEGRRGTTGRVGVGSVVRTIGAAARDAPGSAAHRVPSSASARAAMQPGSM